MANVKGGQVESVRALKRNLKKRSGDTYLWRVPKDDSISIRFLGEPDEYLVDYWEHYDQNHEPHYYPCSDVCPGCDAGDKASRRYLTAVVDLADNKVRPLVIPVSAMQQLLTRYEKYGTLLDRDYEIARTGGGKDDTSYDVIPEPPRPFRLGKFERPDLMTILRAQLGSDEEDEDDDEEPAETPPKRRRPAGRVARRPVGKRRITRDVADEEDDEEESKPAPRRTINKTKTTKKPIRRSISK